VQAIGSTPCPDEAFVMQCLRGVTSQTDGVLREGRILICDRDPKWSRAVEQLLNTAGVRVVRTPPRAPNCNAYAERFVRSVKEECLNRVVRSANGTCVVPSENSRRTTIMSGITKASPTS
jgi:transposase InsO family protein